MGGSYSQKAGARSKIKKYKRKVWLCNRSKDIDQIQDEYEKAAETGKSITAIKYDDELPGGGQFYCAETAKHFIDAKSLSDHKKTKFFKRRVKHLKEEKYTQETAEWASGLTKEKLPPAHAKTETSA
jgi:bud site selection protein 20